MRRQWGIHAVSDMDPEYGRANYPLIWFGDSASEHIVNRFHERESLLNPEVEHDWLIEPLGLAVIYHRFHGAVV